MGECILMRQADGRLCVGQADDEVLVAAEVLEEAALEGGLHPDVTVEDGVLTIRGANRTVVYDLGEPDREGNRPARLRVA